MVSTSSSPENRPDPDVDAPKVPREGRRKRLVWVAALLCVAGSLVGLVWSMTEPYVANVRTTKTAAVEPVIPPVVAPASALEWPETNLSGKPAKERLLEILKVANQRLSVVDDYTATFRKQERIKGKLHPLQTIQMKMRNEPFAVYLKFLAPKKGKEVLYGVGLHDGKVIAHNGDWTRRLIPRLAVAPTDPIALADNRHPVTDVGLLNLTRRLLEYRELDLQDPQAETLLDRMKDEEGRQWLRSVHTHPVQNEERPFYRVEVLYHPDTFIPRKITSYDWPAPAEGQPLTLAESYEYDDVNFDADLTDRDFDLTNPEYEFTRF
jgi:hypothetical protein